MHSPSSWLDKEKTDWFCLFFKINKRAEKVVVI